MWLVDICPKGREKYPTHLAAVLRVAELERKGVRAVAWECPEAADVAAQGSNRRSVDPTTSPTPQGAQNGEIA